MASLTLGRALHVAGSNGPRPFNPARSRHSLSSSMADGGSGTIRIGLRSARSRATSSDRIAPSAQHPMFSRPATRRLRDTGFWGWASRHWLRSSSGIANNPLSSPASKPVRLRAKSAALSSSSSRESRSSSQSAQVTERHHPAESFNFLRGPLNRFIAGAMQVAPGSRPSSSPMGAP